MPLYTYRHDETGEEVAMQRCIDERDTVEGYTRIFEPSTNVQFSSLHAVPVDTSKGFDEQVRESLYARELKEGSTEQTFAKTGFSRKELQQTWSPENDNAATTETHVAA